MYEYLTTSETGAKHVMQFDEKTLSHIFVGFSHCLANHVMHKAKEKCNAYGKPTTYVRKF